MRQKQAATDKRREQSDTRSVPERLAEGKEMKLTTIALATGVAYLGYKFCRSGHSLPFGLGAPIDGGVIAAMFGNYKTMRNLSAAIRTATGPQKQALITQRNQIRAATGQDQQSAAMVNVWGGA